MNSVGELRTDPDDEYDDVESDGDGAALEGFTVNVSVNFSVGTDVALSDAGPVGTVVKEAISDRIDGCPLRAVVPAAADKDPEAPAEAVAVVVRGADDAFCDVLCTVVGWLELKLAAAAATVDVKTATSSAMDPVYAVHQGNETV